MGQHKLPYEELEQRLDELPKDYTLVFYCDRGAKSMLACRDLGRMGTAVWIWLEECFITGENSLTEGPQGL